MTRDPRIYLHPDTARCASDSCDMRSKCARRLAEIPMGSPVDDFGRLAVHPMLGCIYFIAISHAAASRPAAKRPAAKPWPVTEE